MVPPPDPKYRSPDPKYRSPDPKYRSPRRINEQRFFYKYVTAHVAKIILTTRKIRWSSPILFNDPFDVNQELPLNFTEEDLNDVVSESLASLIERGDFPMTVSHPRLVALLNAVKGKSAEARKMLAQKMRQNPTEVTSGQIESLAEIKEKWRQMVPKMRILCLSELNDVTPMWQHYADEYKGVVLEFESVDVTDSAFLQAQQVNYQNFPIEFSDPQTWGRCMLGLTELTLLDHTLEYQYIKATSWSYEKEWRIVGGARQGETELFADYDYHSRDLAGIYFGTQCSPEDRDDLLSLLVHGLNHVLPYEAFNDRHQGKFVFRELAR